MYWIATLKRKDHFTVKKLIALVIALVMMLALAACGAPSSQKAASQASEEGWKPTKTVTFYLYSGQGGDTDTAMRALAAYWQEKYGVTFNVVNMPGGSGGLAANYVYEQPSDGYTLFGMADGCSTMNVIGAFEPTNDVWDIMLLFGGVGCIGVPKDSPYQTLEELVDAAKVENSNITLSCCSPGTIWHVDALQFEQGVGADFNILTYDGSNQAILGLLKGEANVVCSSLGEQSEYIKSGDIRPLAVLSDSARTIEGYDGTIPAITDIFEQFTEIKFARQWNGVGIKADADPAILKFYEDAFVDALESGELDIVTKTRNTEYIGLIGDEAHKFVDTCTSACSWTMWDIGVATISPENFGIERLS
jgi:tripartite-type tricarboxylate transporter receptor subunit TctC